MKAYVVKNKEGKYWCGNDIFSETIDITKTGIYEDFDFITRCLNTMLREGLLEGCEVVEITIAETKNFEKKFVSKNYHDVVVENYKIALKDFGNEQTVNESLVQQLTEKDKEIEELKRNLQLEWAFTPVRCDGKTFTKMKVISYFKNLIRKQVCDEARKKIVEATCYDTEEEVRSVIYDLNASTALEILDEVEKGE